MFWNRHIAVKCARPVNRQARDLFTKIDRHPGQQMQLRGFAVTRVLTSIMLPFCQRKARTLLKSGLID